MRRTTMNKSIALLLTAILLSGCQLTFSSSASRVLRLAARAATDSQAQPTGLPDDEAMALQSLDETGYSGMQMASASYTIDVADYEASAEEKVKDQLFADYVTALSRAQAAGANR